MARRNINSSFGFRRVTEAFSEIARARICTLQSQTTNTTTSINASNDHHEQYYSSNATTNSSSSSSSSSSPELSDLIDSFIERSNEDYEQQQQQENKDIHETTLKDINVDYCTCRFNVPDTKEMLKDLLQSSQEEEKYDDVKVLINTIRLETELACRVIGTTTTTTNTTSPQGFKRGLVTRLRQRGFDSGLCKSRWDKMAGFPAGDYEYVDVIVAGTRYIVEVSLAGEFSIARPTNHYLTLLSEFPQIYVGKAEDLKKVVKLMCASAKESLKNRDMHLPPWRRNGYMEAKWFGFYRRITATFDDSGEEALTRKFTEGSRMIFNYRCGGEVTGKVGLRVGNLALAFHGG